MTELLERTSFLNSANSTFVAELYARYLEKPATVDPEWQAFLAQPSLLTHMGNTILLPTNYSPLK